MGTRSQVQILDNIVVKFIDVSSYKLASILQSGGPIPGELREIIAYHILSSSDIIPSASIYVTTRDDAEVVFSDQQGIKYENIDDLLLRQKFDTFERYLEHSASLQLNIRKVLIISVRAEQGGLPEWFDANIARTSDIDRKRLLCSHMLLQLLRIYHVLHNTYKICHNDPKLDNFVIATIKRQNLRLVIGDTTYTLPDCEFYIQLIDFEFASSPILSKDDKNRTFNLTEGYYYKEDVYREASNGVDTIRQKVNPRISGTAWFYRLFQGVYKGLNQPSSPSTGMNSSVTEIFGVYPRMFVIETIACLSYFVTFDRLQAGPHVYNFDVTGRPAFFDRLIQKTITELRAYTQIDTYPASANYIALSEQEIAKILQRMTN